VDGMDVIAVLDAATRAAKYVRDNQSPYFLESVTYRYRGHSMADPGTYRTKEEIEQWRRRDAIEGFRHRLREEGVAGDQDFEVAEQDVARIVQDAVDFADASPEPDPAEELTKDVYVGNVPVGRR
ncbi:MAG: thiamine pyrophosphate-dependent enzyme, partial [Chloroflexota bacterium]